MDDKLFMVWFVVSFVFRNQTRPDRTTPFLGSWIGSHPHRFVRIDRCVVDRDAVERGDLFSGMISPGIDRSYVKLISPMTASKIQREAGRLV